jgi:hypothetical protein
MGHYDDSRPGYCAVCGAAPGNIKAGVCGICHPNGKKAKAMSKAKSARQVVLLDLDNCIANDAWRVPFIRWELEDHDERYHIYHALAYYDEPDTEWLQNLPLGMNVNMQEARVFVLTARPLRYRAATLSWLEKHLSMPVEALLMRNNGDHRHSAALKTEQLRTLITLHGVEPKDIAFAADDRQEVLTAYQTMLPELPVIHHATHDVCAYTNPLKAHKTVPEILRAAANTFEERNKTYGQNYKQVGPAMVALFPNGVTLRTADEFTRWHMFELIVVKMTRFANSGLAHEDSIHDAGVYAAMVQSFNQGVKGK